VVLDTPPSQALSGVGGIGPYTFAVTAGALPAGITLGSDGTLGGLTSSQASASFTVTATDAKGCSGSQAYAVQPGCSAISVTPSSLPDGIAGEPYVLTLGANGGQGPYTFHAGAGLPSGVGLTTDGKLEGTPVAPGSYPFVVTVTDASGCSGSASLTLGVESPPTMASPGCGCTVGAPGAGGGAALVLALLIVVAATSRRCCDRSSRRR
jgi:MYXO-CTERM domain-containing protein